MDAYSFLLYVIERSEEGSTIVLMINNKMPVMINKTDNFSFLAYFCLNDDVKKVKKEFSKATLHRAIMDFLDEISSTVGEEVKDIKLGDISSFSNCLPKREKRKRREELESLISEYREIERDEIAVPIFSYDMESVYFLPEKGIVEINPETSFDNKGYEDDIIDKILFSFKLDIAMGNPFSTSNGFTFFTASYIDRGELGK
ncbi:hypothetical protein, partial [Acidianus sp. RZ1]